MQARRFIPKTIINNSLSKATKKYVPTPQQATTIINYFLHNNFQDFNTWQQISKSRCEFQYNQTKTDGFQCKVTLKWDDVAMPVIVQVGVSRNKKNSKKKALHKLVQNLIFLGLIGYGFKDAEFIKKLPKRRKQQSEDQSEISMQINDQIMQQYIKSNKLEQALAILNYKNFLKIMISAIRQQNLLLFGKIIRRLQNKYNDEDIDISYRNQDIQDNWVMNFNQINITNPLEKDLTEMLKFCDINVPNVLQVNKQQSKAPYKMELPCLKLSSAEGKISFQFFHPIEYSLIFRRNLQQQSRQQLKNERSSYFSDFYKQIPLPKFEHEEIVIPLPCKVIQKILNLILEFSYNYRLIINLVSMLERQIVNCNLQLNNDEESQKFYLKHMNSVTVQFAYLLQKKVQIASFSIEGLINIQADGFLNFVPKQPEQVLVQKLNRKYNTSQMEEMLEFANQQCVLLVSKLDSKVFFIAQIIQCWPTIKLKSLSFDLEGDKQKLPFTMYKLANAKLYNRLTKSITQVAKSKISNLYQNTFVIVQKPTQPLLSIISQLLAEWMSLTQTVLIVSQNFNQIYGYLVEKGFKVAKIFQKIDEKNIIKKQIVCCNPASVCADVIRNYAFTRIIIEAAQRVSQIISTLALNKGYRKLYLIGDPKLPPGIALTKYAANRNTVKSLFQNILSSGVQSYNFKQNVQQNIFDTSILANLNKFIYKQELNKLFGFDSPLIKGFPWPSETQRLAFIQINSKDSYKNQLQQQVRICCQIVAHVIKSGFISLNEIACRVTSASARALLTSTLYNMLKKQIQLAVNPELVCKIIDFITGSRFKQKSLCILIGESQHMKISHLIAGMQQGRRGLIIMGDFKKLLVQQVEWHQILKYAHQKRLILEKIK